MLSRHRVSDEIPTSSMADIAFLLVVYFMLTLTLASQRGLDFRTEAEQEARVVEPVHSIHVRVEADGSLSVDRRPLGLDELTGYLRPRIEADPEKPVVLETDPRAPYGAMVEVYDRLRGAGDELGLPQGLVIAIPTQREIATFWS